MEIGTIKDIKLKKGMSKDEVNILTSRWIELIDDEFKGAISVHNWRCKCKRIFPKVWNTLRANSSYKCDYCKRKEIKLNHKQIVEENKNYRYIDTYFIGDILPNGDKNDRVRLEVIHIYCGSKYIIRYDNFIKYDCDNCCIKYENSFAYHIVEELGLILGEYWDFELNEVNPYHIWKCGIEQVFIKCNNPEKPHHKSYVVKCANFYNGQRCSYCNPTGEVPKVDIKDSLYYKYPDIASMIVSDKYGNSVDVKKIAPNTHREFYFKCFECGKIDTETHKLDKVTQWGYSCKYCSDGISIPEKFLSNILRQINVEFDINVRFKWSKDIMNDNKKLNGDKVYDFYIKSKNMIIETNGRQHYEECTLTDRTLEEEIENDIIKYQLAIENGIKEENYIAIDCRVSKFKFLKKNIEKALSNVFEFETIDFKRAYVDAQKSLKVKAWNLWNEGKTINEIANILGLSISSIRNYIKDGETLDICKYEYRRN